MIEICDFKSFCCCCCCCCFSLLAMYLFCKWEILKYVFLLTEDLEFQAEKLKFNFINVASF